MEQRYKNQLQELFCKFHIEWYICNTCYFLLIDYERLKQYNNRLKIES